MIGILGAVLSAITNVGFLTAYPVGCTTVIAIDVLVIYALAVHGSEAKPRDWD